MPTSSKGAATGLVRSLVRDEELFDVVRAEDAVQVGVRERTGVEVDHDDVARLRLDLLGQVRVPRATQEGIALLDRLDQRVGRLLQFREPGPVGDVDVDHHHPPGARGLEHAGRLLEGLVLLDLGGGAGEGEDAVGSDDAVLIVQHQQSRGRRIGGRGH